MNSDSVTMAADSTQKGEPNKHHETPSEKRANKRKRILQERRAKKLKKSQAKKRKNRSWSRSRGDSDSDCESDLDLRKELNPVGHYVHHREEMLEHMFRSISNKKLKAMMPECVKELNIAELKTLCLEQLDMMSRKRILRILDGADPDTISSTDTEDDSTEEEEENVSEGGSTGGSVVESPNYGPGDGSQSQHIDSTSLQEDKYSECSDSTPGSPQSNSGGQLLTCDLPLDLEDGQGAGILDREDVVEAEDEAEKGIAETVIEMEEQETQEEETEETTEEVEDMIINEAQGEQEEGEVEEEDVDEVKEEEVELGQNEEEMKEDLEEQSKEGGADMEELQLDVPQAEMEVLFGSGRQSPEEGEVFDDDPPLVKKQRKTRSHRNTGSRHLTSSSRAKDTKSRRSSKTQSPLDKTSSRERRPSSTSHSKSTSVPRRKERSKSDDAARSERKNPENPSTKVVKGQESDHAAHAGKEKAPPPALMKGPSKKETVKVAKDAVDNAQTHGSSSQKVATRKEEGKAKIPQAVKDAVSLIIPRVEEQLPITKSTCTTEVGSNLKNTTASKAKSHISTEVAAPAVVASPEPEVHTKGKPTQKLHRAWNKGDMGVATKANIGSTPTNKPKEKTMDIESPHKDQELSRVDTVKTVMKKSNQLTPETVTAVKAVLKPSGSTPQSQNLSSSTPSRSVLMPQAPNPQALPRERVTLLPEESKIKKAVKIKRPAIALSNVSEGFVVQQPTTRIVESSSRVVEPPKTGLVQPTCAVKQPSRVVIKRDVVSQSEAPLPLVCETQRRVQLRSSPTAPVAIATSSRSVVQSAATTRTVLKRPHSITTGDTPIIPTKTSPGIPTTSGSKSQCIVRGQGGGGRTVIQRYPSAPAQLPEAEANYDDEDDEDDDDNVEDDAEEDLSPNQREILELEMRARAIKAMLKAQVTKQNK